MKDQIPCKQCPVLAICITKSEIFCKPIWDFLDNFNGSPIGTEAWKWIEDRFITRTDHIEVLFHSYSETLGPYRMREDMQPFKVS